MLQSTSAVGRARMDFSSHGKFPLPYAFSVVGMFVTLVLACLLNACCVIWPQYLRCINLPSCDQRPLLLWILRLICYQGLFLLGALDLL